MKKKENQDNKDKHICTRCGDTSSAIVVSIKTRRGTTSSLCSKCVAEGI